MNKNKILPIVCAVLLLGAIIITVYFKGVENKISKEKVINREQNIENKVEEKVEIINQEQETIVDL